MNFTIRPMIAADLIAVERIQAEAYAGYFLESTEVIAQRFHASPDTAWVAIHEEYIFAYLVGYCSKLGIINPLDAPFAPNENADCLYLHDLAIAKNAQGFGLSKKMMQAAVDFAQRAELRNLALLSVQNSKQFWSGLGFSESDHLEPQQQANLQSYLSNGESAHYMTASFTDCRL